MLHNKVITNGSVQLENYVLKNNHNICSRLNYRIISGSGLHAINHSNYEIIQQHIGTLSWIKVGNSLIKFLNYKPAKTNDNFFVDLELNLYALHSTLEAHTENQEKLADVIISLNLIESFCNILVAELNSETHGKAIKHILEIICICLDVVPNYCVYHLRQNAGLMEKLFSYFITKNKTLFNTASKVMLNIFDGDANCTPFSFSSVKGIRKVLQEVKGCAQTVFYQVLLAVISETENLSDIPFSMLKQHQQLWTNRQNIFASNNEFLLNTDGFLEKLFTISTREVKDIPQAEHNEMLTLLFTLPNLTDTAFATVFSGLTNVISDIVLAADKGMKENVLFILTFLFSGKYKEEIQERFVKCNMVQRFYNIFHTIIWNRNILDYEINNERNYIKVQFLRLLCVIFDNHQNRFLFLSRNEMRTLKEETENCGIAQPSSVSNINESLLVDKPKGLLSLVVDNLELESKTSFVRFWIFRCLESFLRGPTRFCQYFLLQKNLLEKCLKLLISGGLDNVYVKQGIFDFLSVLFIKNMEAFERSESVLDCTATFNILICDMKSDLIDSNTFIRSIILTLHHFKSKHSLEEYNNILLRSKLLKQFSSKNAVIDIASSSLNLLSLQMISEGNVCCLNTCILILVLAYQDNELPVYLSELSKLHDGVNLLKNLRTLLQFWIKHYTLPYKNTQRHSLEESSGISFEEWKSVVNLILSFDQKSETSVLHYMEKLNL